MRTPDVESQSKFEKRHNKNLGRRILRSAAIGASVLASIGVWKHFQKSGEYESFGQIESKPAKIDNKLRIASWNMHGEAANRSGQIGRLATRYKLDAIALQEVTRIDASKLHENFKTWYKVFVLADAKQQPLDGGYGNMLLTRQKPRDIKVRSLPGSTMVATASDTVAGLGLDFITANKNLSNAKNGMQESRASIAATIKVLNEGKMRDVRIVTGHITGKSQTNGPEIHNKQFDKFIDFIDDNIADDRPTVVVGDFNSGKDKVVPALANLRMITNPNDTPTSASGKIIDYSAYYEAGILGLGRQQVLSKPETDHNPIIASWDLNP